MLATPLSPAATASTLASVSLGKCFLNQSTRRLQFVHTAGRISSHPFQ
jgi:hypothetical protein